jgi:HK97 family phage prohead protease
MDIIKELAKLEKSFDLKVTKSETDGVKQFTFFASVEKRDRDNDIIMIDGIEMSNFEKNPVFLAAHDDRRPPVGKVVAWRKATIDGSKCLEIDVEFADTEAGREYQKLYDGGFMNAVSIRFIPAADGYKYNDGASGFDVFKCELVEVSAVSIPANQYALIKKSWDIEAGKSELENRIVIQGKEIAELRKQMAYLATIVSAGRDTAMEKQASDIYGLILNDLKTAQKKIKGESK